jgi:cell division septation protein DedD
MDKKIIGSIGLVVGLGLAGLFLYVFLFQNGDSQPPAPSPPEQPQVAVRPAPVPAVPPETATPASREPVPPVPTPSAPPAVVPVPAPEPPTAEEKIPPLPALEPTEKDGLLVRKFRRYEDAAKLLEKIKKQEIPAFIRREGKHYEVWAGPFSTPQEAEQARKSLRAALKISAQKGKLEIPVPK